MGVGCAPDPPRSDAETVVMLHGLGRTSVSLALLERRVRAAGYRVVMFDYPSTTEPFDHLVDSLGVVLRGCCSDGTSPVHFVTHSMGGVLVRSYLTGAEEWVGGRVVMLSPPNQGSEIIDAFGASPLLVAVVGPAGARLGTDSTGVVRELDPVDFELGVIAGDRSLVRLGSWLIPGPDDGLVGVESARVEGITDFLVVPANHTTIMNRRDVADAVISFLKSGKFDG